MSSSPPGDFEAHADEIASSLPNPQTIYLSRLGAETTRTRILEAFDQGASLLSYVGHGGIQLWAQENIFNSSDVSELTIAATRGSDLELSQRILRFPLLQLSRGRARQSGGKGSDRRLLPERAQPR